MLWDDRCPKCGTDDVDEQSATSAGVVFYRCRAGHEFAVNGQNEVIDRVVTTK